MGLLETAAATLIGGERSISAAARNVTNANTPGYKREVSYTELTQQQDAARRLSEPLPVVSTAVLGKQGALSETGNPLDLAVNGTAMMLFRDGDRYTLSRGGQLAMGADGTLVDALGRVLQQAGGGDLELTGTNATILPDGTILDGDVPVGAIGLYDPDGIEAMASLSLEQAVALAEDSASELRQGMVERSNVTLSDEMVTMMRAQRQVESGAQMVRAYDQLMSQAISTFSRSK